MTSSLQPHDPPLLCSENGCAKTSLTCTSASFGTELGHKVCLFELGVNASLCLRDESGAPYHHCLLYFAACSYHAMVLRSFLEAHLWCTLIFVGTERGYKKDAHVCCTLLLGSPGTRSTRTARRRVQRVQQRCASWFGVAAHSFSRRSCGRMPYIPSCYITSLSSRRPGCTLTDVTLCGIHH